LNTHNNIEGELTETFKYQNTRIYGYENDHGIGIIDFKKTTLTIMSGLKTN